MDGMIKDLYLIGNGFDLHHCINSSFNQFKDWLKTTNSILFQRLFQVYDCQGGNLWNSFEENLGNIPLISITEDYVYAPFILSINNLDEPPLVLCLDNSSPECVSEIGMSLSDLYFRLENSFFEWILQLNKPSSDKAVRLNKRSSFFINFNYTDTLESIYGIPYDRIFYIHGCVNYNQHLIFGHNQPSDKLKQRWLKENPMVDPELMEESLMAMQSLYKDVEARINANFELFNKFNSVNTIHIWGVSLSNVDLPYLLHLRTIVDNHTKWEFHWYEEKDRLRCMDVIEHLSIKTYSLMQLSQILTKDL